MAKDKYYITTPIYYVNDVPHIGNAYTTIMADIFNRYKKLKGKNTFFLTGTDENATKVDVVAKEKAIPTREFVDSLSEAFKETWSNLGIEYDQFIRTTDEKHIDVVSSVFKQLLDQGDIYKGKYEGWYCLPCETFFLESELIDGCCPNPECKRKVEMVQEENYYFKLSAYENKLLKYIKDNPDFLMPEFRKNEVIGFIKQGLRDVSITRKNTGWGIPVPGDDSMVLYVWFDALINYISAAGYLTDSKKFTSLWPTDLQLMGKDIFVRFHCTFWPAILWALGLDLPKHLIGHGFWTINGEKISKSKGNAISPFDLASQLAEESGATLDICKDVVKYYLARETSFGMDGDFSIDNFKGRYNSDLANDLGNLLNRTLGMLVSYNQGIIPKQTETEIYNLIEKTSSKFSEAMDKFLPNQALDATWELVSYGNKYINDTMPWILNKEGKAAELQKVLYSALLIVRACAILISPFMPDTAKEIFRQLGINLEKEKLENICKENPFEGISEPLVPNPIFPRLQSKKQENLQNNKKKDKIKVEETVKETKEEVKNEIEQEPEFITIDDLAKLDLRVGIITEAEKVENADKLLKLSVDIGTETRTICAGMAPYYEPEYMIGKQVIIVANLKPRKIRGIVSHGMMLAAGNETTVKFLSPEANVSAGDKVS